MPAIFSDEGYKTFGHIILSTSTLSSPALDGGGFGPVNDDCYGIGYGITDRGSRFVVSSYRPDGNQLADLLSQSLQDMSSLLTSRVKPAA